MMNRTLEAFATRKTEPSDKREGKSRKTLKKRRKIKDDSDGCIDTWVEVMRLHLEQDNLNDEKNLHSNIKQSGRLGTKMRGSQERLGT